MSETHVVRKKSDGTKPKVKRGTRRVPQLTVCESYRRYKCLPTHEQSEKRADRVLREQPDILLHLLPGGESCFIEENDVLRGVEDFLALRAMYYTTDFDERIPAIIRHDLVDADFGKIARCVLKGIGDYEPSTPLGRARLELGRYEASSGYCIYDLEIEERGEFVEHLDRTLELSEDEVRDIVTLLVEVSPAVQDLVERGEISMEIALLVSQLHSNKIEQLEDRLIDHRFPAGLVNEFVAEEAQRLERVQKAVTGFVAGLNSANGKAGEWQSLKSLTKQGGQPPRLDDAQLAILTETKGLMSKLIRMAKRT